MARKATGNDTSNRSKKTEVSTQPAVVQTASEVRKNGEMINLVPSNRPANIPANIEEKIRRRAYEIYLERRATASENGDQNQDWLVAEREIRSGEGSRERHLA
jgi:Protein of unknown function (DUF2934)